MTTSNSQMTDAENRYFESKGIDIPPVRAEGAHRFTSGDT